MAVLQLSDNSDTSLEYVATRNLITSVGVAANATLTKTDVEHLLVYSGVLEDISNWVLADLLVWGEELAYAEVGNREPSQKFWDARDQVWGEMLRFCKKNTTKSAAYHLVATAKAWPYERRRHTTCISFEHHRLLSGYPPDQQEYWMDVAEAGEWSSAKLRQSLYSGIDPLVVANTPPHVEYTPLWTRERMDREINLLGYDWEQIGDVMDIVMRLIGDYEDERKSNGNRHPQ